MTCDCTVTRCTRCLLVDYRRDLCIAAQDSSDSYLRATTRQHELQLSTRQSPIYTGCIHIAYILLDTFINELLSTVIIIICLNYPYVMIGACIAAGRPLPTANVLAMNLTIRFFMLSVPCTMMPLRKAITSGVPPPAAGG